MNVLEEIARYLIACGTMPASTLDELEERGFLPRPAPNAGDGDAVYEEYESGDFDEDELERALARALNASRTRAARPTSIKTTAEELEARIAALWPHLSTELVTLEHLGGTSAIVQEPVEALALRLAPRLREDAFARAFVDLLLADRHAALLDANDRGPAPTALRVVIGAEDVSAVGKHAWVLRYAQVAELFRFLRAQRALSRALVALRRTDRVALDRRLRASHPAAWWALLLSYNAHRRDVGSGVDGERSLERPLPPEDTWRRAWRFALVLDPAVRAFLEIFFPEAGVAPTPLYVPRGF